MKVSNSRPWLFILEFMLITNAIATSAGVGFGMALRLGKPQASGSSVLHSKQSFPPRQDWPVGNFSHH
ncbi:hypothetical protein [Crocosphaera sp. Alani8]|uniref:hypothetical protein n=1 Tax=Crocosphaera sp. Alani8 TaxID=3038952 RepID=UPI00313C509A